MPGGTSPVQRRNSQKTDLDATDFVRRKEYLNAQTAWARAIGAHLMLPGLRAFYPGSGIGTSGVLVDMGGASRHLTRTGNTYHGCDGLAPYVWYSPSASGNGYHYSADHAAFDITGTESEVLSTFQGLTMGGWFRVTALSGGDQGLVGKYYITGNQRSYLLRHNNGTPLFVVSVDGTATKSVTGDGLTTDVWKFVAGRFDPSTSMSIFVDSVKANDTTSIPASIFDSTAQFEIGTFNGVTYPFYGKASLCFVCASALPDATITALYQQTRRLFGV